MCYCQSKSNIFVRIINLTINNLIQQMLIHIWISKGSGGYDLPKALDEAVVAMLLL